MLLKKARVMAVGLALLLCLLVYWHRQWTAEEEFPVVAQLPPLEMPPWPIAEELWRAPGNSSWKPTFPISKMARPPMAETEPLPQIQATFDVESMQAQATRLERQNAVRAAFLASWHAYKKHAWMADELRPMSGEKHNALGGWAATVVDSLDTLWIMGLHDEFAKAVAALEGVSFNRTRLAEVNTFKTTVHYLGGFLSAFELSGDVRLLRKAVEVGDMMYKAFDTPSHMPVTRWNARAAVTGLNQTAAANAEAAEVVGLSMEFTRLSQITGDPKWFDAVQRVNERFAAAQDDTALPGMWPQSIDARQVRLTAGTVFSLGSSGDSMYEHLPKMAVLTGGQLPVYQSMYEKAINTSRRTNFFRPMLPGMQDVLVADTVHAKEVDGERRINYEYRAQHGACFAGAMLALGSRLFGRPKDLALASKLTDGCVLTAQAFPFGIMPESVAVAPCMSASTCKWDDDQWRREVLMAHDMSPANVSLAQPLIDAASLPPGFTRVHDSRYTLRSEAVESVFVLYRATARADLPDAAWDMFTAIDAVTRADMGHTAVSDVTNPKRDPDGMNSMGTVWMGSTLKYFYLMFCDPQMLSLDEYVFNTEGHPMKRLRRAAVEP
ncbi:unnamed protein product [Clonostachys rosea f. rosea IK726]|jgi:mannosyl-oligosaccharide alpha-1,2-mannosidase|uniref:Uncharacterized protein n=1 Tax=Clonostachys rosea f. rosea IK726 TaxID=1349383 RepID=A0ACA9UNZ0_BIOOC|nr:unnamed protein product [Clonostachys rosea f. rosea IK726]